VVSWRVRSWLLPLLVIVALVLVACGGGGGEEPAAEAPSAQEVVAATLDVAMGDLYFGETADNMQNPPVWTVKSGGEYTLNLKNNGGLEHNWAIVKAGTEIPVPFDPAANADVILWDAGIVQAGQSGSATFTAPAAGEYAVICTVAGHYPSMQGKLVVE